MTMRYKGCKAWVVAVTTKWPWMNDYLKNVHSGRQANECYIIFSPLYVWDSSWVDFFFIIKNIYNLLSLGTRSLTWLYTNRILYARHKFLYAGFSVSQLKFFSHYSTQHNFFSLWFPQFLFCLLSTSTRAFHPIQPCTTFIFFLPISFTSQALLFPTRMNLKLKSMGKQQTTAVVPRTGETAKLFPRSHMATNYMQKLDLSAHGASYAW